MKPADHPGGIRGYWNEKAEKALLGKKIINVRYMTREEAEQSDWYSCPVVFELSDGTIIIPMADDEGNNGGSLDIQNNDVVNVLPVI